MPLWPASVEGSYLPIGRRPHFDFMRLQQHICWGPALSRSEDVRFPRIRAGIDWIVEVYCAGQNQSTRPDLQCYADGYLHLRPKGWYTHCVGWITHRPG